MSDLTIRFWNDGPKPDQFEVKHFFSASFTPEKIVGVGDSYKSEILAVAIGGVWKTTDGNLWKNAGVFPAAS